MHGQPGCNFHKFVLGKGQNKKLHHGSRHTKPISFDTIIIDKTGGIYMKAFISFNNLVLF
jgi:hypothetical protein